MAVPRAHAPSSERIQIPRLNRDPVLSLRPWPVVVSIRGEDFTIPALPATDWLNVLMRDSPELDDVFPGLLAEEDQADATEALSASVTSLDDFSTLALGVVELAAGRPWWVAFRLIGTAKGSWDVLGAEMLLKGIDADQLSLSAWLDVLLLVILRNLDQKDVTMFTLKLESPPPEAVEEVAEELTMTRDAFASMM